MAVVNGEIDVRQENLFKDQTHFEITAAYILNILRSRSHKKCFCLPLHFFSIVVFYKHALDGHVGPLHLCLASFGHDTVF